MSLTKVFIVQPHVARWFKLAWDERPVLECKCGWAHSFDGLLPDLAELLDMASSHASISDVHKVWYEKEVRRGRM